MPAEGPPAPSRYPAAYSLHDVVIIWVLVSVGGILMWLTIR
jgi:hypothetical protein